MSGKINAEIEECVRSNVTWQVLPVHLKQVRLAGCENIFVSLLNSMCDGIFTFHVFVLLFFLRNIFSRLFAKFSVNKMKIMFCQ